MNTDYCQEIYQIFINRQISREAILDFRSLNWSNETNDIDMSGSGSQHRMTLCPFYTKPSTRCAVMVTDLLYLVVTVQ